MRSVLLVWGFVLACIVVALAVLTTPKQEQDTPHTCGIAGCVHDPDSLRPSPIDSQDVRPAGEWTEYETSGKEQPVTHDLSGWEGYQARMKNK
jgi:hypothetical protein